MARILVIDDDVEVRAGVIRILQRMGHHVQEAGNGVEAMRLCRAEPPDLVITDINMPEMDGIEVILGLHEIQPDLPVVAISGGGLIDKMSLLEDAGSFGAVSTLAKPFELADLIRTVEGALGLD